MIITSKEEQEAPVGKANVNDAVVFLDNLGSNTVISLLNPSFDLNSKNTIVNLDDDSSIIFEFNTENLFTFPDYTYPLENLAEKSDGFTLIVGKDKQNFVFDRNNSQWFDSSFNVEQKLGFAADNIVFDLGNDNNPLTPIDEAAAVR